MGKTYEKQFSGIKVMKLCMHYKGLQGAVKSKNLSHKGLAQDQVVI